MTRSDGFRPLIGAYLTGLLDAGERADLEDHLRRCRSCREELARLAPLPSLLRRLPPPPPTAEPRPAPTPQATGDAPTPQARGDESAERLAGLARRAVRRQRVARRMLVASAALASLAAAGAVVAVVAPARSHVQGRIVALKGPVATGQAVLQDKPWGTQIVLTADRLPEGSVLVAAVYGPGGESPLGSWSAPSNGRAVVDLATDYRPSSITRLVVFSAGGGLVLHS